MTVNSLPTPTISGPATACLNVPGNQYSTQTGMSNYVWSVTGGTITAGGQSTDATATVTWTSTGAKSISVNYADGNTCTAASPFTYNVAVNSLPTPTISGPATACLNVPGIKYSTQTGMSNYVWSVTGGTITAGGQSTDATATVTWTSTGAKSISVNYADGNTCTAASPFTYNVTVNSLPTPTISGPATACLNVPGSEYSTQTGMSNYVWSVTGGTITAGGQSTNATATVTWTSTGAKSISVNYTNGNSCTAVAPFTYDVTVNPLPAPTISGPATACLNVPGSAYSTQTGMSNYVWSVTGGTITAGGQSTDATATVTWTSTGSKSISVNYDDVNSCTAASPFTYNVTVSPLPVAGTITIDGTNPPSAIKTACSSGDAGSITLSVSGQTGSVKYWQSSTDGGNVWTNIPITTATLSYNVAATTVFRAVVESGPCQLAYSNNAVISVIPQFKPNPVTPTPRTICAGDSSVLSSGTGYPTIGLTDLQPVILTMLVIRVSGRGVRDVQPLNVLMRDRIMETLHVGVKQTAQTSYAGPNSRQITYQKIEKKFAIAAGVVSSDSISTLETSTFSLIGQTSSTLQFVEAFVLENKASATIEISTDGGTTYSSILEQHRGPDLGFNKTVTFQPRTLSLANYIGLSNLKIRFTFKGTTGSSWGLDEIVLPNALPITYTWSEPPNPGGTIITEDVHQTPITVAPPVTTTYTITTYVDGCYAGQDTVTVFVNPLPSITLGNNPSVCQGTTSVSVPYTATTIRPTKYTITFDNAAHKQV